MERGLKDLSSHLVLGSPLNQPPVVQVTKTNAGQVKPKRAFILLIKGGSWHRTSKQKKQPKNQALQGQKPH